MANKTFDEAVARRLIAEREQARARNFSSAMPISKCSS